MGKTTVKKNGEIIPIILCWLVYSSAYLGRYSYSSNINSIIDFYNVSHADAGLVTTLFFFAYGVGQVVNGLLCSKYNQKTVIFLSLFVSSVINLAIFFGAPFYTIKYLWLLNGICQSVLWPTLISVLSRALKGNSLPKALVFMGSTTAVGTFVVYGISSLLAIWDRFDLSFIIGAILMLLVGLIWLKNYNKYLSADNRNAEPEREPVVSDGNGKGGFIALICALALFGVITNFLKDGLGTWVPSILKEKFELTNSLSILLSLALPVLGIFSTKINTVIQVKIPSFTTLCGLWFAMSTVCTGAVCLLINTNAWYVVLLLFALINLFMNGANSVITGMAPLYMRNKVNSGLVAGVLNSFCYLGSTISSYGLGYVVDTMGGWGAVFTVFLISSAIPVAVCLMMGVAKKLKNIRKKAY